jgi:SAM-dependent methyltransferase
VTDRLSLRDAVEGFHLAGVVRGLDQLGVLDAMECSATPAELAATTGVDADLLGVMLEFLAGRTNLVQRDEGSYRVTTEWSDYARACVRQYVGAYGRLATHVVGLLRDPSTGPRLIDQDEHARSYRRAPTASSLVADLILQLGLTSTLDLGCGSGSMLIELGRRDTDFVGWGVDSSEVMCDEARAQIATHGLDGRVTVVHADAFDATAVAALVPAQVRSITATSLLNELWGTRGGGPAVVAWLRTMAAAFPGRAVVIADYFGRLGHVPPPWPGFAAVHDFVQALSGQGIPPPDHGAWRRTYEEAGVALLHMVEDENASFFIHLLRLPGSVSP